VALQSFQPPSDDIGQINGICSMLVTSVGHRSHENNLNGLILATVCETLEDFDFSDLVEPLLNAG
jgi:hypothetical protein